MRTKQRNSCRGIIIHSELYEGITICITSMIDDFDLYSRNINWSSPEILSFSSESGAAVKVDQSADVWSLVMVLSEIFTGEIPYDSQHYRQMDIHSFNAAIKEGHRPKVPPRVMNITWLNKLVRVSSPCYIYIFFKR